MLGSFGGVTQVSFAMVLGVTQPHCHSLHSDLGMALLELAAPHGGSFVAPADHRLQSAP